jgi:hypothetical protein
VVVKMPVPIILDTTSAVAPMIPIRLTRLVFAIGFVD